jgi:hypothetical protein
VTLQRNFIVRTDPPATLPFHTMPGIGASDPGDLVAQATGCLIKQRAPNNKNKDTTTGAGGGEVFAASFRNHGREPARPTIYCRPVDCRLVGGGGLGVGCRGEERPRTRRGGDGNGEPCARCCWEELACGEGQWAIAITAVETALARAAARTRSSLILPTCGGMRRERIETMPTRGEDNPL